MRTGEKIGTASVRACCPNPSASVSERGDESELLHPVSVANVPSFTADALLSCRLTLAAPLTWLQITYVSPRSLTLALGFGALIRAVGDLDAPHFQTGKKKYCAGHQQDTGHRNPGRGGFNQNRKWARRDGNRT